ncbi:MAG: HEAT repeat domain-containing protein [Ignavibacteriae bacterium]|nr:HEAT repeat domain-containing protein [Ignavibacteriota bacterium]
MKKKHMCSQFKVVILVVALLTILASLLNGCASSTSGWKEAQSINTLEAYQDFLDSNPSKEHADSARWKIDTLSFLRAKQEHTISSYDRYLRQFPRGEFAHEVSERLEKLFFHKQTEAENSVNGYDDFLQRFPNGVFANEARSRREQLYFNQQINVQNTITAYESYLKDYPDGKYVDSARSMIEYLHFEQAKSVDVDTTYLNYLKRYPEGRYKADALGRIELIVFRKANKGQTIEAFEEYIRQYPQGMYIDVAKHNIEDIAVAYRQAKVVQVIATQLFYQKNPDGDSSAITGVSLPIESLTRRLLAEHANVTAVGPDAKSFTATLNVKTEGVALGNNYGTDIWHFTGASLSGKLSFDLPGYPSFKRSFSSTLEPPVSTTPIQNSTTGTSSPFTKVFKASGSYIPKLIELIYKLYGASALSSMLHDNDEDVRISALEVCSDLKVQQSFNGVMSLLRDNNFAVRQRAALALGKYKDPNAVDALVRSLQDVLDFEWIKEQSSNVRESAAIALGMIGSSEAVKPLITALKDQSMDVRREATKALTKITANNFGGDYDAWMKWYEEQWKK